MRIAILGGGGAMGGLFGGYLAARRRGRDPDRRLAGRRSTRSTRDGLAIEEKDGSHRGDPGAGRRRPGLRRPGRPHRQLRQVLPHRGGGRARPRRCSAPRPRSCRCRTAGATPTGSPRSSARERVLVGLTYHGGTLLGARPGQASRHRHDLHGRARRPRRRRGWRAIAGALRGAGFEVDADRRGSSTRSGRSSRSTSARCRPPALLRFCANELVAHDGTQAMMGGAPRRGGRGRPGAGHRARLRRALGGDHRPAREGGRRQGVDAAGRRGRAADRDRRDQRRHRRRPGARHGVADAAATRRWSGWSGRCRRSTSRAEKAAEA